MKRKEKEKERKKKKRKGGKREKELRAHYSISAGLWKMLLVTLMRAAAAKPQDVSRAPLVTH